MFNVFYHYLDRIFGLSVAGDLLNAGHMIFRILVIYIFGIILVRLQRQFMAINTPFNYVLNFTLGSIIASAVTGEAPFLPVLGMTLFMFVLNYLVAAAIYYNGWFETLVKGNRYVLVKDGQIQWKAMRDNLITKDELLDAVHEVTGQRDLENIAKVFFENDGRISVIEKKD